MKVGWQTKNLGDICFIDLGKTPFRDNDTFWDEEKRTNNAWLSIADLQKASGNVITDSKEYISDEGASLCKIVKEGTLLVSFKLTLGRLAFAGKDLYTNEAIAALTIKDETEISKFYLYYYLTFFDWQGEVKGDIKVKGKTLNKAKLKKIEVLFPSIAEQFRIVNILSEFFADHAELKRIAEKNLQNSKNLFESYLQNVVVQNASNWSSRRLEDLTYKIGSGATPRGGKNSYQETGISLVRSMNVHDRRFVNKKLAFISDPQANELKNVELKSGDVLLNITGASVARCCVMSDAYLPARVNQHVSIIRPKHNFVTSSFLNYLLTSKYYKDKLLKIGEQGATRQAITKAQLENFVIQIPETLSEQNSISSQLDSIFDSTGKLEAIYSQKLNVLDELKQSVLAKAFAGEL